MAIERGEIGLGRSAAGAAGASETATRIRQLDVLRGIAILGILFLNLPPAATTVAAAFEFPHLAGWSRADQWTWWFLEVFVEGTQRGLLQFLFGASAVIVTARAMSNDGPVIIADLYYRRNLWLLVFGLANIFILLFPGDILFIYAVAALLLFPFRKLGPKALLTLGLAWTVLTAAMGMHDYYERSVLVQKVGGAEERRASGAPLSASDIAALVELEEARKAVTPDSGFIAADTAARRGSFRDYAAMMHNFWLERAGSLEIFFRAIPEAFCAMLIGAALFKWRVLQGNRRRGFYLLLGAAAYLIGLLLRAVEAHQQLTFTVGPRLDWIFDEFARLATTLGHVCLISLIFSSDIGKRVLSPFEAAGKTAFTLYVMQTLVIMWILFPAFGLGLWGELSWSEMALAVLAIAGAQMFLANVWLRTFAMGPVEWLWRSLVQLRRQPFRRSQVSECG